MKRKKGVQVITCTLEGLVNLYLVNPEKPTSQTGELFYTLHFSII